MGQIASLILGEPIYKSMERIEVVVVGSEGLLHLEGKSNKYKINQLSH